MTPNIHFELRASRRRALMASLAAVFLGACGGGHHLLPIPHLHAGAAQR
eukprot:gene48635-59549_t